MSGDAQGTPRQRVSHWTVHVEAVDETGHLVESLVLAHGADPGAELARRGWSVTDGREVRQEEATLTIVLDVTHTPSAVLGADDEVRAEDGLTEAEIANAVPYQRVAVYAIVETERGLLLTELSERTWVPGEWTLPGGGIDPGESALDALHREVWEETDQSITDVEFLGVRTSHWIGRSPGGRVEDFQAVRLYYRGHCPSPSDPVVHDVDGSTASAAWVPRARLEDVPVTSSLAPALAQWLD